ncbi:cyclodeaminase/cyclohydrolase family protein [Paenibacillus sp.]|uniref:cyclodeaminase/cyclohydrolase family protein n=1 Tax=Paenibacillus sp. TaxID=58172 RepID=UPI00281BA095|nr:cyclodeaminase/cyclohydrolase family protein [Paenibacillus sp.]MDR0270653.1 cyclodeaminase/cyclohydrolase family protein [Paenibacillus sp.]
MIFGLAPYLNDIDQLGIIFDLITFEPEVTEQRLLGEIERLNRDSQVHGIMLELPLPKHISVQKCSDAIAPEKDVDGISSANKLACMTGGTGIYPATPQACIRIAKHFGFALKGKRVVLVGRGETVGRPLMQLLLRENATVTVCHSHTQNLADHIAQADFLMAAVGHAGLITADMMHPELVVIDAGINETATGITGDVVPEAAEAAKAVTPVPGGVGTLTTVMLFENLMLAIRLQQSSGQNPNGETKIFDQSIRQFLQAAASSSPTPGGGSIAALSAALGASMGSMVANITTGPKFEHVREKMADIVKLMQSAMVEAEFFLKRDMESFSGYMAALGLPKASEEQKQARSTALQQAAVQAASVPLSLMKRSLEIMTALAAITEQANKNVISDLGIALIMLDAAVQSAWITVEINLGSIKDASVRSSFEETGAEIAGRSKELKLHVVEQITNNLG